MLCLLANFRPEVLQALVRRPCPVGDIDLELAGLVQRDDDLLEVDGVAAGVLAVRPDLDALVQQRGVGEQFQLPVGRRERDPACLRYLVRGHRFRQHADYRPAVLVVERVENCRQLRCLVVRRGVPDHPCLAFLSRRV